MPWIDRWVQEDQSISIASFVFRKVSNDEGDCFFAGFRVTQDDFGIRPQFLFKRNSYSIPENRKRAGALEELLTEKIGSNDLDGQ